MLRPLRLALIGGPTAALIAWKRQEVSSFIDKGKSSFFSSQKFDERFKEPPEADVICTFNIGANIMEGALHYYPKDAKFSNKLHIMEKDGRIEHDVGMGENTDVEILPIVFPKEFNEKLAVFAGMVLENMKPAQGDKLPFPVPIAYPTSEAGPSWHEITPLDHKALLINFLKSLRQAAEASAEHALVINEKCKIKYMFSIPDLWFTRYRTELWSALKEAGFPIKGDDHTGMSPIQISDNNFTRDDLEALIEARVGSRVELYPSSYIAAVGYVNFRTEDVQPSVIEEFGDSNLMTIVTDNTWCTGGGKFCVNASRLYNVECFTLFRPAVSPLLVFKGELARAMFAKHGGVEGKVSTAWLPDNSSNWALDLIVPGLLKAGKFQKAAAGRQIDGETITLPKEDVHEIFVNSVVKSLCDHLSYTFQGPSEGTEKVFLQTDHHDSSEKILAALIQLARIEQDFSRFGFRLVDIGPATKDLAPFTQSERISRIQHWMMLQSDDVFSDNWREMAKKEGWTDSRREEEGDISKEVYQYVHNKYVRKLNYDPLIAERNESVDTVPIQVAVLDKNIVRIGLGCMGQVTLKALVIPALKRVVTATDGAIVLMRQQGDLIVEGDEDDIDGFSGDDMDVD